MLSKELSALQIDVINRILAKGEKVEVIPTANGVIVYEVKRKKAE